jgi:hypothetical protein
MNRYVDIHAHILHGIDDGPAVIALLLGEQLVQPWLALVTHAPAIVTWVRRMWLPDGSRKPASIP